MCLYLIDKNLYVWRQQACHTCFMSCVNSDKDYQRGCISYTLLTPVTVIINKISCPQFLDLIISKNDLDGLDIDKMFLCVV